VSPHPMVITTSEALTASVVRILGRSAAMSIPPSAMASTAMGLILSAGSEPAERTSIWPGQLTEIAGGHLVNAGILTREQRGKWAYYRLVPGALDALAALITSPEV
jgi:DNA-binding transcriptional ArsR family regulator